MIEKEDKRRCSVCKIPYFERNNYFFGKLMTVRDFQDEQKYFNEKRWLINRMVLGWGVVCGLEVVEDTSEGRYEEPRKVIIRPGLAIDCCGREILVCKDIEVPLVPERTECHEETGDRLVVCLEYRECKTERVNVPPKDCDSRDGFEYNRIRDSFEAVVRYNRDVNKNEPHKRLCPLLDIPIMENKLKSLHDYVCGKIITDCYHCPECPCLVLAEIQVEGAEIRIDLCSKRKIIYSNPVLFELINCYHGDLPHITDISWLAIHGRKDVKWGEFESIIRDGLKVTFDKHMKHGTINQHTFLFSVFTLDENTGERDSRYIPAKSIKVEDAGHVTTATFVVRDDWLERIEALSQIKRHGGTFEILMRGSSIMGRNGKALDAEFIGGNLPSGNGSQGGDFVSWFHVERKSHYSRSEEEKLEEMEE